jgi:hypothetical protein
VKFSIRKFIDAVAIGLQNVEVFQKVVGVSSFGLIEQVLDMINCLMSLILVSDCKS